MPMCVREEWDCPVDELKKKVAHLERASLWLARQLWLHCPSSKTPKGCEFGRVNVDICSKCWTDYAMEREQ